MKQLFLLCLSFVSWAAPAQSPATTGAYFPPSGEWIHRSPASMGMNGALLDSAIRFARDKETKLPRNMETAQVLSFGKEPFGEGIGPFSDRGEPTGVIVYKGYIVAEWGNPLRVDMAHSVTKSFLSAIIGVAVDQGLIHSADDTIASYLPPIETYNPGAADRPAELLGQPQLLYPFSGTHNRTLTWEVMLRQTSDWEGTLWGKPDWADRPVDQPQQWLNRKRNAPGTVWKYNDVRVNALALAATNVWRQPLPQVLKQYIMDPIGASNTWRWNGYRNAWIVLDGTAVQSVSGGGHWGGGMFLHAYDMARFGLLTLHRGQWNGRQLLSEQWVHRSLTPTTANPQYGYMNWFLNTDRKLMPSAPPNAFVHIGNGANLIYVDPDHQLVAVIRWIEPASMDGMIKRILAAVRQ